MTDVKIHIMVPVVPRDAVIIASVISVTMSLDTVQMDVRLDSTGTCVTVTALHARQHVTEVQGYVRVTVQKVGTGMPATKRVIKPVKLDV